MKKQYTLRAVFVGIVAVLLSACAPMVITGSADVANDAFGPKKKFAVVSISAMKTFHGEKGFTQLFKDTDEIPGANSQPLIDSVKPTIIRSFGNNHNLVLLSEKQVLSSRAYKTMQEDERKISKLFFSDEINVPPGYKYFSNPKKYAQLAEELNVDGVIGIHMGFSITSSKGGVNINGLSFGRKSYSPIATITAMAYDRQGRQIWEDSTVKQAEPGDNKAIFLIDFSDVTSTDFRKMHPKAIEIGDKAVNVLLTRLDDSLAGKGTSSMQSMK